MKFLVFLLLVFGFSESNGKWRNLVFTNGSLLKVEVARSIQERNKGLMGRKHLPSNQGMLFIFERPQKLSFWTKNTYIPLSIGFFDQNRVLREIHWMKPQNRMEQKPEIHTYRSRCQCQYAIEVNRGWFQKNGIQIGNQFSIYKAHKNGNQFIQFSHGR